MNILPKKRWHVRTKENIARVRKDEAEAAEKEREEQARIETANREARLSTLKNISKQRLIEFNISNENSKEESVPLQHVNLFEDLEHASIATNKEHDKEVKDKKEEYEKKIGYLTYLGQDTNEALGKKNWYEVLPNSSKHSDNIKDTYDKLILKDKDGKAVKRVVDEKDGEIDWKLKQRHDPINNFKHYCEGKHTFMQASVKHIKQSKLDTTEPMRESKTVSKHKKNKGKDKETQLQKLREARLKREQKEKHRTEMFLAQMNGDPVISSNTEKVSKITPKYNSQFNPQLARQNYERYK